MNDSEDDIQSCDSGYATPPLSPTKSISTEGWLSPRTPTSPHKGWNSTVSRIHRSDLGLSSPPESPTKPKYVKDYTTLQLTDTITLSPDNAVPPLCQVSPVKKPHVNLECREKAHVSPSSLSHAHQCLESSSPQISEDFEATRSITRRSSPDSLRSDDRNSARSLYLSAEEETSFSNGSVIRPDSPGSDLRCLLQTVNSQFADPTSSPPPLRRLPIRSVSSPLRPSQWVARAGLINAASRSKPSSDRFIPPRRPPNLTKQSFDLNKPEERLNADKGNYFGDLSTLNPFSRSLRRSVRMNEELRGLRETHAILTGRSDLNQRRANAGLRRGTVPAGIRQISAGAVWNVGGSSAANDTVLGVSNGSGGLLGSGTNAPLYTSMFLSRSDPDAELEAYERRVALALDIDQMGRVLDQSSPHGNLRIADTKCAASSNGQRIVHVWKDNAWIRDSISSRWFNHHIS